VSPYGLFQHYDQHPNLAVSCTKCQITFENHQALIVHKTKLHPDFLTEFNDFKSKQQKKGNFGLKPLASMALTAASRSQTSAKQALSFQAKSKSSNDVEAMATAVSNPNANDLSALPSIMTRTSRITNGNGDKSHSGNMSSKANTSAANNELSIKTTAAILNHALSYKTTGKRISEDLPLFFL
jgi:hypothetical protein